MIRLLLVEIRIDTNMLVDSITKPNFTMFVNTRGQTLIEIQARDRSTFKASCLKLKPIPKVALRDSVEWL
jgi:hypothetical protein